MLFRTLAVGRPTAAGKRALVRRGKAALGLLGEMSICIPKDLADQLLAALGCKGLSGASQASSSTDTTAEPNTAALTTQMTRDVIQAIQAAEHVERPLSAPNTLRHVMTWFTQNTAPRELNFIKDAVSFDWMGTARIYLSPLNIGFENLATALKDGSYTVDWIRVKLLSITLSTAESSRAIVETDDYTLGQSTWIGNDGDATPRRSVLFSAASAAYIPLYCELRPVMVCVVKPSPYRRVVDVVWPEVVDWGFLTNPFAASWIRSSFRRI